MHNSYKSKCLTDRMLASIFMVALIASCPGNIEAAQVDESKDVDFFDAVLDKAFPTKLGSLKTTYFTLFIRYSPAAFPPSQIVIRYGHDSSVSIDYMKAAVPFENLYGTEADSSEWAKRFNAKTYNLRMESAEFLTHYDAMWKAIAKSTSTFQRQSLETMARGGCIYQFKYLGDSSITIQTIGPNIDSTPRSTDSPFVRWMLMLRAEMERKIAE